MQFGKVGLLKQISVFVTLLLGQFLLVPQAYAQHTSTECPAQTASVTSGGFVTIDITDCAFNIGFAGSGVVDGGSFGPADLPDHGTAVMRITGGRWYLDYSHNGTTGIGSTDVFEFSDGSFNGDGDVLVTITINPATSPITVAPSTLPTMTAGTSFSQTVTATGGVAPYSYSLQSGVLPVGITLSSSGVLSGTPTQRGGYSFSVRATDSTTPTAQFNDKGYTGTVQNPSLTLVTASGTAIQNSAFSQTLVSSGGVAPYSYLLETGTFPAGITMSSAGVISGTTTAAPGNYPVTIRVTDSSTGPGVYFEVENYTLTVSPPPSVSIAVSPASVSEDGATNLTYTVTRSLNLTSPTTVNITTTGTATAGTDYAGNVATIAIPAGATTATIVINPTVDGTVEPDETVTLTVAAGAGYTVGVPASATGTILNDDVPSATVSVSPAAVAEDGAPNLIYTFTLNQASFSAVSLNYTIGGTATNGTDYATIASPLVIPAGNTTGTVTVNPTADATIEADETVTLTLAAGTGYIVAVPNSATGTILNDDLPNLTINDVSVTEGNSGTTNAVFTVSLSAPAGPGGVTFNIATANGTATGGVDYVTQSLTGQTIPAGSSTYTFTVLVNGDLLNEPNESFFVNVTGVTNAVVVDGQGVGTITNDDALPSLSINDVSVVEGDSGTTNAVFTVTLSAASGQTVTVNYATADGTATQPADYSSTSGTLTFTPGQTSRTITVPVIGETVPEGNETYFVNLSGASNATIADNQSVGTISNDDVPVTLSPNTLPNGTVATAYSQTITASGGVAPYGFSITAGSLPAGLSLSSGGVLSGTPTAGGSFNFTVTALDSSGAPGPFSGNQAYTLTIAPATVTLPAASLPGGTVGVAYSSNVGPATGGTAPYSYAVTAGALPPGVSLATATGNLTGTPTAFGTFNFSVTATDSSTGTGPYSGARTYSVTVIDIAPIASASSATVAYNAAATNIALNLSGGAPTSLSITTAPANGTATVTGTNIDYQPTPGYAGPDSFAYTATNSGGTSAPATVSITVQDPVITITPSAALSTSVAAPYTQTFTFNGGMQPWSGFQVTNVPAGITVTGTTANSVTISGAATQAGTFNLNVSATDSSTGNGPYTVGQAFALTVAAPTLSLTPASGTLNATYGAAYSQTFTASGGTGAYSYAVSGTLPAGLSFTGSTLSGTPTAPGSYPISVTATDTTATGTGSPFTVTQNYTVNVAAPVIDVTPGVLPAATAGAGYSQALTAIGGVAPYSLSLTAGSLPSGLTLAGGTISGTPTQVGSFNFTITATDANTQSGAHAYTLTVNAPVLTLTPASGATNVAFNAAVSQSYTASGGVGPYGYAITAGALPSGVTLNSGTGQLSGSTVQVGTFNFTVTATDTGITGVGAPFSVAGNYSLVVAPPVIAIDQATLTAANVASPYNMTLTASGGLAPYSFSISAGALPAGLSLSSGGVLSGTPTAGGTFNFSVRATDASGAPGPFNGVRAYTLTVAAPTVVLPSTTLVAGQRGNSYSAALNPASGGTAPYTYVVTAGALPAGVSLSASGTLAGTPTVFGSFSFTVTATDSSTGTGPYSANQAYTLSVVDQPPVAGAVTVSLPYGAPSTPITLNLTGGAPTAVAIASAPTNGTATVSGTSISYQPNASFSGTDSFTYTATNSGGTSAPASVTVTVGAPVLGVAASGSLNAVVGVSYSQTFNFSGGTAPFGTYQVTGMPAGLSITGSGSNSVTVSGVPRAQGTFTLGVSAKDSSTGNGPFTVSQNFTLSVAAPNLVIAPASGNLTATYAAPFSQAITASGGIGPYSYALGGALPAGLTLNTGTGAISGTPTASGSFAFSVTATDTGATGTGAPFTVAANYTLTIAAPTITVTPTALPAAIAGQTYSAALTGSGAVGPYGFTLTGGALPTGLTLAANGQITGTPTASGNFAFTVQVRDANGQTGTANLTLTVGVPVLTVTPTTLPAAAQGLAYNQTLTASGGVAPYSFAVSSGTLPAGLTLNTVSGVISGTPTASGSANFAITVTDSTTGTRATLTVNYALVVAARPDPANDPEVRGLVQAQVAATRRFADAQVDNFMQRMESMHGMGSGNEGQGDGGTGISFRNNIRVTLPDYCRDAVTLMTSPSCAAQKDPTGVVSLKGWKSDDATDSDGPAMGIGNGGSGGGAGGPWTVWTGGAIRFGEREADTGRLSQDFESEGITVGADYRFSRSFAAGLGVGLGRDTVDVGIDGSRSRGEAKTIAVYGSHMLGKRVFVDWLGGYQDLDFDLRRYVTLTGLLVNSKRSGHQWFGTLSAGADFESGNWQLTPYARFDITRATLNGYTESSGSMFDLTFLDQNVNFTSLGAGMRFKYRQELSWATLLPQLRAEYQRHIERSADARVTYVDRVSGPFSTIPLAGVGREELTLGAKLELLLDTNWALATEYTGRFSPGNGSDNMVQLGVKVQF